MAKSRIKKPQSKSRRKKNVRQTKPSFMKRLSKWVSTALSVALLGAILFSGLIFWLARDLPKLEGLQNPASKPSIEIMAQDGSLLAHHGQIRGEMLRYEDIPPAMVEAIIAIEDRRFFDHRGIDPRGILRAAVSNFMAGHVVQGGSTLTQQLAKNLFLTPERTFSRKAREALLAMALERDHEKEDIISLYLNRVYLGGGAFGIDAASRLYFNKSARSLSYGEAAVIAGLVKAPSRFAPTANPDAARNRAKVVLQAMEEAGYLSKNQRLQIEKQPPQFHIQGKQHSARYFTDWIVQELADKTAYRQGLLRVETSLDIHAQNIAEAVITSHLSGPSNANLEGALVAMRRDGSIVAMVGGKDYKKSVFNRATQAKRQPGSAFKLFVYLSALEAGLNPKSTMRDSPIRFDGWAPRNHWGSFSNEHIALDDALARSYNSIAVKVSERVGRNNVIQMAKRLGIESSITPHPSVALGTSEISLFELTHAYAIVANGGLSTQKDAITAVNGQDISAARDDRQLLNPFIVQTMSAMLEKVIGEGTGKQADPGRPAAGKTGTSQDGRDGWFIGYTADMVVGVWVGRDDGKAVKGLSGGRLPARIWADFVRRASQDKPPRSLDHLAQLNDERRPGLWRRLFKRN